MKKYMYKLITKYGKYLVEHVWYEKTEEKAIESAKNIKGRKIVLRKSLDDGYSFNKVIKVYVK